MYQTDKSKEHLSDLACERGRVDTGADGVEFTRIESGGFVWEKVKITGEDGVRRLNRPLGSYYTLHLGTLDALGEDGIADAKEEVARELCSLFDQRQISPSRLLVVGLGTATLTPDSIGPKTASLVEATMHCIETSECSKIAVCTPDVTSKTGLAAFDTVAGICGRIHPDAIIAVDSLACTSHSRLGSSIQLSDTGIFPGSGVGNGTHPINEGTTGIPVVAIGTPTILRATVVTDETDGEPCLEKMLVCPRQIDAITDAAARIIAGGINQAFGEG